MAEGRSAFKRSLAVDIEKPSHQEASQVEDFPSPPPLYTPTTKEVDETLDKEMADQKPTLGKSLSLSIERPTDKAAEESEPPPVDPLPTPSQKEIDSIFDKELKQAEASPAGKAEACSGNGAETTLSKSQKKKAKKKAKKSEGGAQSKGEQSPVKEPKAYVPGAQWEPDGEDDDDMCQPAVPAASPVKTEEPAPKEPTPTEDEPAKQETEPKAYVPGSKWEPDDEDDDLVPSKTDTPPKADAERQEQVEPSSAAATPVPPPSAAVPAAPVTPASVAEPSPPVSKPKADPSPPPKRTELRADTSFLKSDTTLPSAPKPVPSKLSSEVISKFAAAAGDAPLKPAPMAMAPSGGPRKWAPVPPPVLRKSLVGVDMAANEKQAPVEQTEPDVPEPTRPVEYSKLLAGNPGSWPKGIKADQREKYLSDEEFEEVFNMCKADFAKLKQWKKNDLKKAVKLF